MKDGGPAFPTQKTDVRGKPLEQIKPGMTMRQYYKAHAPEAAEQYISDSIKDGFSYIRAIADWRGEYADAMIAEDEEAER